MNTAAAMSVTASANTFTRALSMEDVRERAPAVFASSPHARMSGRYTFIQTERVLSGLMQAGFVAVDARQARSRRGDVLHVRHLVRLRRQTETVEIDGSVPEVLFLNSHDGSSAYELRVGLFRFVCTNGLIVSTEMCPAIRVPHRRDVVDEAIAGAIQLSSRFDELGRAVERMQRRVLREEEQVSFAERALVLRFGGLEGAGLAPSAVLMPRRPEDAGNDLWRTFNRVQENVLRGGLSRRSSSGRLVRTRRIQSIKEDVRLNGALWDAATAIVA
ncbi:DUF932 domain-containing protein [Povalibacter sp.]|uniref:DUF932 domain-containing protein n=1 Tax=Povalibacter sp. TaxID=1962978 RepID=UPI002F3E9CBC